MSSPGSPLPPQVAAEPAPGDAASEAAARARARWLGALALLALLTWLAHLGFFVVAAAMVAGILLAGWTWATSSVAGLRTARVIRRAEVEIGETVPVRLIVTRDRGAPVPWLYVEEQLERGVVVDGPCRALRALPAGGTVTLSYRLTFPRRGLHRVGPTILEAADPWGLIRRFRLGGSPDFVTVLPRGVSLTPRWPLGHRPIHEVPRRRSFVEDPSRFIGVRDFRPGDPLRRVHWRATARLGRIQVRQFEPAVLAGALIVLDVDERSYPGLRAPLGTAEREHAEDEIEHGVTVAVSLSEFVLSEGQAVGLLANGADAAERHARDWSGSVFRRLDTALAQARASRRVTRRRPFEVPAGRGARHGRVIRTALARLVPSKELSLPELLAFELPRIPRSLVMVVVTPLVTPALGQALASIRRCGIDVVVLWLAAEGTPLREARGIPDGVPVHRVGDPASLSRLGELAL